MFLELIGNRTQDCMLIFHSIYYMTGHANYNERVQYNCIY